MTMIMAFWFCLLQAMAVMSADADTLQDFCVADLGNRATTGNGLPCLDPNQAKPEHFMTSALNKEGNTSGAPFGLSVTFITPEIMPGVNTLGLTMARADIAVGGQAPPHFHPRATEMVFILKGTLLCGFVDTTNKHFSAEIKTGDVFVFPKGLLHYVENVGDAIANVLVAYDSQSPGVSLVAYAAFDSNPPIADQVLTASFKVSPEQIRHIRDDLPH